MKVENLSIKQYKALVQYFDRKANCLRVVWLNVEARSLKAALAEAKASFTTFEVVEA